MKTTVLLLLFTLPALSVAQPSTSAVGAPAMSATGAFFALSVADVHASARWYAEKLGLTVVMEAPRQEKTAVIVLEGNGLIVELLEHDQAVPLNVAAPGVKNDLLVHGVVKAGAIVSDFDGTVALLKQRNVQIAFGPYPATAHQRANVIIKDNAGNLIQLFGR